MTNIIIFNTACLFENNTNSTIIYGQYIKKCNITNVTINNISTTLIKCKDRPDFIIKIKNKINEINNIIFYDNNKIILTIANIKLYYPFDNCNLKLNKNSAIISTMCKDYGFRLEEWIKYNLKLGFSGIIIFDNTENNNNYINEKPQQYNYFNKEKNIKNICDKYKDKVFLIKFDYSSFPKVHYDSIQRIALHIGVNEFKNKCKNIALIDADEFIYLPKNQSQSIETFLSNYKTITMQSNILTNKNDNDYIDNNILSYDLFLGENKYTKTILDTSMIKNNEFIVTPHKHNTEKILNKDIIIHYHLWINKRYKYNTNMIKIDLLKKFMINI